MKQFVVAICGASGAVYGLRLLKALAAMPVRVLVIVSDAGKKVLAHEAGFDGGCLISFLKQNGAVFHEQAVMEVFEPDDWFAPPASGSFRHNGMVIAPCSMKTLGALASGVSADLISRAGDVCLKDRRPLILVTRETPLNAIHLKNMHRLTLAGATIMPPCPSFYFQPKTIEALVDTVVARILDHLNLEHDLMKQWGHSGSV